MRLLNLNLFIWSFDHLVMLVNPVMCAFGARLTK